MQHINKTARRFGFSFALIALTLLLTATSSHAITVWGEVWVRDTWVKVIPGSNTGGAVIWNDSVGWYTDRVSRGEQASIACRATKPGERGLDRGFTTTCGTTSYGAFGPVPMPANAVYSRGFVVPVNAQCDNLRIWVKSNYETSTVHMPIGTRP